MRMNLSERCGRLGACQSRHGQTARITPAASMSQDTIRKAAMKCRLVQRYKRKMKTSEETAARRSAKAHHPRREEAGGLLKKAGIIWLDTPRIMNKASP